MPDTPSKRQGWAPCFTFALRGWRAAWREEGHFRWQLLAAIIALASAVVLNFTILEWVLLIMAIGLVLTAELFNSALEATVDLACERQWHPLAAKAKDLSAGAVLAAAATALIMGLLLFLPKFAMLTMDVLSWQSGGYSDALL